MSLYGAMVLTAEHRLKVVQNAIASHSHVTQSARLAAFNILEKYFYFNTYAQIIA